MSTRYNPHFTDVRAAYPAAPLPWWRRVDWTDVRHQVELWVIGGLFAVLVGAYCFVRAL